MDHGRCTLIEINGDVQPCAAPTDSAPYESCSFGTSAAGTVISLSIWNAPPMVTVDLSEGGAASVRYPVVVFAGKPFYPNGKRCGTVCTSGTGELALPPAPSTLP